MERTPGDFQALLQEGGLRSWALGLGTDTDVPKAQGPTPRAHPLHSDVVDTHGTTVIAVKYDRGVLNVGDRRATANMAVMFDRAEKVIALDDFTLIAISGSFARS